MKKLSISLLALLAIVFAVTSAFNTHKSVKDTITYSANSTQANPEVYDLDVTLAVQNVGETTYRTNHCTPSNTVICFARFQDGTFIQAFKGLWH